MEKKKRGRPAKKKTESIEPKTGEVMPSVMPSEHCETFGNITVNTEVVKDFDPELVKTFDTLIVSGSVPKDKAYFKSKLETLAAEISIAIKEDRSLAIRLKSVYVSINHAAKKL